MATATERLPLLLSWQPMNGGYVAKSERTHGGVYLWWRISLSEDSIGCFTLSESAPGLDPPATAFGSFSLARESAERREAIIRRHVPELVVEPKPVIDGEGEYWCVNGSIASVREAVPSDYQPGFKWRGAYKKPDHGYNAYRPDGTTSGNYEPYRIVAKVVYRQRPLTPEEAFKLLGRTVVWKEHSGFRREITDVGMHRVTLSDRCEVELQSLGEHYTLDDGSPLSVSEPIPLEPQPTSS